MPPSVLLLTGASTGIGLAAAVQAAQAGFTTIATMRNTAKADLLRTAAEEAGVAIDIRQLDVVDAASIESCISEVVAEYGQLDVVINNAGSGHLGTIENDTVEAVREVMEVNFFGVVAVTKESMPHLRASKGRLITVTSVGGVVGQPFNESYCAAKFAVEGFMEALAPVATAVGVRVSVVEPGPVASEFVANVKVDFSTMFESAGPYEPALRAYITEVMAHFGDAQSSDEAAAVIMAVLKDPSPPLRTQTSEWATAFVGNKIADLTGSVITSMTNGWVA